MEYAIQNGSIVFESLWRTRYENYVPINEMEDEHIINTINYLQSMVDSPEYDGNQSVRLPISDLPQTEHNIEVLKREIVRRNQASN